MPECLPTLHGERLTLRESTDDDVADLVAMLSEEEVATWWGRYDAERVRETLRETACWSILVDERVLGWLHAHEENEPEHRNVAFDIALGETGRGRGLGQEALRLAVRHYIERGHHRFTIDPTVTNERAVRSYESVGFRPVGVMRAYARDLDGRWQDGLLMDLLAVEFSG